MGKQLSVFRAVILFSITILVSCGDMSVKIRFESLTSGQVEMSYLVLREFSQVGGRNHPLNWPVIRSEWTDMVGRVQGVTLETHSLEESPDGKLVKATLRFANLQSLEGISIQFGQRLTVIPNQNIYTMTFNYQVPDFSSFGNQSLALSRIYLQGREISWEVQTPRTVRDNGRAQRTADNRGLTLKDSFIEALGGQTPVWRAQW